MTTPGPKIITPTIGRRVHYYPSSSDLACSSVADRCMGQIRNNDGGTPQLFDAGVVFVWNDRMVNLDVTDHYGRHHALTSVPLLQEADIIPENGGYAQWMPYQVGQAKQQADVSTTASPAETVEAAYERSMAEAARVGAAITAQRAASAFESVNTSASISSQNTPYNPASRNELLGTLVHGAAAAIAEQPGRADAIADGILAVLRKLAPIGPDSAPTLSPPLPGSLEADIRINADNGPRVTPEALQAVISSAWFFTGSDGAFGAAMRLDGTAQAPADSTSLGLLTICVLELTNGFTVIGHSACASPENFNKEIGQRIARENAERQIWPLLGYELKTKLAGT